MRIPLSFRQALLAIPLLFLCSCGGNNSSDEPEPVDPEPEELPRVLLSFSTVTLPSSGDVFICRLHSDGALSASADAGWCTASVSADNMLTIAVEADAALSTRESRVAILASDGREITSLVVRQQPAAAPDTPVSVTSWTKCNFFPMFTATWCPFSPEMDRSLQTVQRRWEKSIIPMRIHVRDSELYTPLSVELSSIYDNSATPTGYFDNYIKIVNVSDGNVGVDFFWNLIMSYVNMDIYSGAKTSLLACRSGLSGREVEVGVTFTPAELASYRLQVFLVEDGIVAPQMSGSDGEIADYRHDAVLVGSLTPVAGEEFNALSLAQKTVTVRGSVPDGSDVSAMRVIVVLLRDSEGLNLSDACFFVDNCMSLPLGNTAGSGSIENIYVGEDIEN